MPRIESLVGSAALVAMVAGCGVQGPPGRVGPTGPPGADGSSGPPGPTSRSCWYVGVTAACGFVRDIARNPVVNAKVYLVPGSDIPRTAIDLSSIDAARASMVDEPLEDSIALKGAIYPSATTDANGLYQIEDVAPGSYFVTVIPDTADRLHLPGGSSCRTALSQQTLLGTPLEIKLSTRPSDSANFVGNTVCMNCHGMVHVKETLHALSLRVPGTVGPLQDSSRFPNWNMGLQTKFTLGGTKLYVFGYNQNPLQPDWKVSEMDPGVGVDFTVRLYTDGNVRYFMQFVNVAGPAQTTTYEVVLTLGGGLNKQRYITKIGRSYYDLPIQFNFSGRTDEMNVSYKHWVWRQINAQNWYSEIDKQLIAPAPDKSFDANCAGCHFTGFRLTGDATQGFEAHSVPDPNGEFDFDGDGRRELIEIGCEVCHGPGSEHGAGPSIVNPSLLTPERELMLCNQCHSRPKGIGAGRTTIPMNANRETMRAGTSRADWLANYVSSLADQLWDTSLGDGKHSRVNRQQGTDFLKSGHYRNPSRLVTCTDCHDPHGNTPQPHLLRKTLDSADSGDGLCMGCHDVTFPSGSTLRDRIQTHSAAKGIHNTDVNNIRCTDCHMAMTGFSAAGSAGATIQGVTYYQGDTASHVFDVPLRTDIATKGPEMMPIAYTNPCGLCHQTRP